MLEMDVCQTWMDINFTKGHFNFIEVIVYIVQREPLWKAFDHIPLNFDLIIMEGKK